LASSTLPSIPSATNTIFGSLPVSAAASSARFRTTNTCASSAADPPLVPVVAEAQPSLAGRVCRAIARAGADGGLTASAGGTAAKMTAAEATATSAGTAVRRIGRMSLLNERGTGSAPVRKGTSGSPGRWKCPS
jgi:hypothetical protein